MSEQMLEQVAQESTETVEVAEDTAAETETAPEEGEATATEPATEEPVAEASDTEEETGAEESEPEQPAETPYVLHMQDGEEREYTEDQLRDAVEGAARWDDFADDYDKVLQITASMGMGSVSEALDTLVRNYADHLERTAQNDAKGNQSLADELLTSRKDGLEKRLAELRGEYQKKKTEAADQKKAATNDRLASEFIALHDEFPEFAEFKDVPKPIITMALKNNISLLDAKLRFDRSEQKKVDAAKKQESEAAASSIGSMNGHPVQEKNTEVDAAVQAFRRNMY